LAADEAGFPVLRLLGELDFTNAASVDERVETVLLASPDRLVIDVSGLEFIDSSGIALWVGWANVIGDVEIRGPSLVLRRSLERLGLAERLR
jgi:anti-anti-sigma factor